MSLSRSKTNPNRNARILVVEDNAEHRLLIKSALHQNFVDIEPVLTTNDNEAQVYLDDCVQTGLRFPQLILMDLYLPNRENGWSLLKAIKSEKSAIGQIPIVVFSHSDDPDDITESYQLGATSYVVKPADSSKWIEYFQTLKDYWWETVSLPNHKTIY